MNLESIRFLGKRYYKYHGVRSIFPRSTNLIFLEIKLKVYVAMWKRVFYDLSSWNLGCLYLIELGHLGGGALSLLSVG